MYRITEKLPLLTRHQKLIFYRANGPLFHNVKRFHNVRAFEKKGGLGKALFYGIAVTTVVGGGVIAYAKYDQKFRNKLNESVPGSDAFIRFILQEDMAKTSIVPYTSEGAKNSIYKKNGDSKSGVPVPPPLVKTTKIEVPESIDKASSVTAKSPTIAKQVSAVPISHATKEEESCVAQHTFSDEGSDKKPSITENEEEYQKYNILTLQKEVTELANQAMTNYSNATQSLKAFKNDVVDLIEKSILNEDHNIWYRIKERNNYKNKIIEQAESKGEQAMERIEHIKLLINDSNTDLDANLKEKVENEIKNVLNNLVYSKALFIQERSVASVAEKYSKKVEEARQSLSKELGVLFPSLVVDSESIISDEDLDLFVMYTCQQLNFYQKEMQRMETLNKTKIEKIIEQSSAGNPEVVKQMIELETEKIRRDFAQELFKKERKMALDFENELRKQLLRQAEIHADYLKELIEMKNQEMQRNLKQNVDEKVESININYNRQLARIIGRMKGLDVALKEKSCSEKQAKRSQLLWNACQSLILSLKSGTNTKTWEEQLKPLNDEIKAISKATAENDVLVEIVIASIPKEAVTRGVFSELALKDRFMNVERLAYRLAGLTKGSVSLPKIFLAYLQSILMIKPKNAIPKAELLNEPFDVSSLTNYDVLSRARYWIDRDDFEQCLKYMNLLKGASRAIANEWMNETRIFLETQQAANVLLSHAVYSNFIYLQNMS